MSNKMLLNGAKCCQGCSFYRFGVIKGRPTVGEVKSLPLPPRLGLTLIQLQKKTILYELFFLLTLMQNEENGTKMIGTKIYDLFNFCFPIKPCNGVKSPFFITSKVPSSDNIHET